MTKLSRTRQHTYLQQRYHPIFCTPPEVEMPHLIKEYLHNASDDQATTRNHSKYINSELNANLEQILRGYLVQFWRHEIEKEQGGCTLWDEVTGFTPRPRRHPPNSSSSLPSTQYSQLDSQWWWQPSFAQDDGPSPTNKLPLPPSVPLSVSPNPSSPNSPSSSDSSPGTSPYAGSPRNDNASTKTRWQLYAERLFALLLRLPHFNLNTHMQRLIRMHKEANTRNDTQLSDIIRNYLTTVLQ